jgi:chaperonin GroEL (HSP60 family)
MSNTAILILAIVILVVIYKIYSRGKNTLVTTSTDNMMDKKYTIVVKNKRKEDKKWQFFKEIEVKADIEYTALMEASYLIAGSDNPRINYADVPISATVTYRSKNISYRFEISKIQ